MKSPVVTGACLFAITSIVLAAESLQEKARMYSEVQSYLEQRVKEFDEIPNERKSELQKVAGFVRSKIQSHEPARLTFICTHNSRRSHMSQIWAATAAGFYGIEEVEAYSGGTEATAFNPRAIAAIERAGLRVKKTGEGKNPRYAVRFRDTDKPLVCFSKVYNDDPNPKEDFCAVMTCTQADENCPVVAGSFLRAGIYFDDPKVADDTPEEAAKYDERCRQICREMLYLFSRVGD